jgi:hypothetical protein
MAKERPEIAAIAWWRICTSRKLKAVTQVAQQIGRCQVVD